MNDGQRDNLTGHKLLSFGEPLSFKEIKASSRALGCTINDLITSSLSIALKQFFESKNDGTQSVNITLPANIRWKMYETFNEVRMENKFAPIFMTIPLLKDPKTTINKISKITKDLKKTFPQIYLLFIMSKYSSYLLPDCLLNMTSESLTKQFTLAFSNTPGML